MRIKTVAKLFKEPAQWPLIPPWWLLPSPQAAAFLNIKPATLQSWRIRGEGPEPVPPRDVVQFCRGGHEHKRCSPPILFPSGGPYTLNIGA